MNHFESPALFQCGETTVPQFEEMVNEMFGSVKRPIAAKREQLDRDKFSQLADISRIKAELLQKLTRDKVGGSYHGNRYPYEMVPGGEVGVFELRGEMARIEQATKLIDQIEAEMAKLPPDEPE